MENVRLDYAVPAADLADYVTLFYDFSAAVAVFDDVERADNAQIRFRLSSGGACYRFADGTEQDSSDIHVIGPTSGAVHVHAEGPIALFGMGVTAVGWAAMIGADASTMVNRVVDAGKLFGLGRLQVATAALRKTEGIAARAAVGEELVRDLIRSANGHCTLGAIGFVREVDAWLAASPSPEMEELLATTGLSRRQVERKCNALYGAPPKLLARKYRALRAAVVMAADAETIGDAVDRGFYDQSHMIREIKQFTGLTPGQIRADPGVLPRLTIAQRSALDGVVSPLVSGT